MNSFNPHNPRRGVSIILPILESRNRGTKRWSNPVILHLTLCAQSPHSSAERCAHILCCICFIAEWAAVTFPPSLATLLLLHLSLLLSCFFLTVWFLGCQPSFMSWTPIYISSSGPGFLKNNPETTSPMAHARVFRSEHCPWGKLKQASTAGGCNSERKAEEW